jgi:hypothetical protein
MSIGGDREGSSPFPFPQMKGAPVFLSPLVGESEREGATLRRYTLTLALSHQGRGKILRSRILFQKRRVLSFYKERDGVRVVQ